MEHRCYVTTALPLTRPYFLLSQAPREFILMNSSSTHFVTGATGFVGSGLVLELLQQTNDPIYCLVREKSGATAENRLHDLLFDLIDSYRLSAELKHKVLSHCLIIAGDLTTTPEALVNVEPIDYFWHVAASLNYEERFKDEIFETNVEGTRNAIQLATALNTQHFYYFSTAYVAGKSCGTILESTHEDMENSNVYEESKVSAELLVSTLKGMNYRIFRPSIVIGQSKTYEAINFTGLYGFIRRLVQFKGIMNRVQKGYLENNAIKMFVEEATSLNLVPVDMVVSQAVKVGLSNADGHIFHLTNPNVPTVGQVLNVVFDLVGLAPPKLVDSKELFNHIDDQFNEKIDFYNSYLVGDKQFDRTTTDSALGIYDHSNFAVTEENIKHYCAWYLNKLLGQRKAIPVSR